MIGVCWNYHGLNKVVAIRALRAILRKHNPEFIYLSETKLCIVDRILNDLGFFHFVSCPPKGTKVSMIFTWKSGVDVEVVCLNINSFRLLVYSDPPNLS